MSEQPSKLLSNVQAYSLTLVCLLLGIAIGYLLNAPKPVASAPQAVAAGMMPGGMPTPEQLRHMADKKAEPLLAELQKDPKNPELLGKVAGMYFRARQFPVAVEYYERAVKIKPSEEGFVNLSNALHYAGSDDRAIESLNRALELNPKSANALFNLGMLSWQARNDVKTAIAMWQRLLKTNPNHPQRAQVEDMIAKAKKHIALAPGAKSNNPSM